MTNVQLVLPEIDLLRCDGCGICVRLCPTAAVTLVRGQAVVTAPERCTFCEICESYCPQEAIGRPFRVQFGG